MSAIQMRQLVDGAKPIRVEQPSQKIESEPRELDIMDMAARSPEPPRFVVPGWIPEGEVGILAAHGGTGKSTVMLQLAVCIALGIDFYGQMTERRHSAYISFEDTEATIHWRLSRICKALGIDLSELQGRLRIFDGTTCASSWFARTATGEGPTPAMEIMRKRIDGAQFVVVDGSSDVFAGNENDRSQVKAFLRSLRTMIPRDGALMLLAHVDKQGAKSGAASLGFSGSTGWHNGVRSRWFMYAETDGDDEADQIETGNVCLEVRKSNLGRSGASMKLRYDDESGVFVRIDTASLGARKSAAIREAEESAAILRVVKSAQNTDNPIPAASTGTRSAHVVADAHGTLPDSLTGRRGRKRFYAALEKLRAEGRVKTQPYRRPNRHVSEVLYVAD